MKITGEVINDLWPLYQSGEASRDTCLLIDTYLEQNPDFAQLLAKSTSPSWHEAPKANLDPEAGLKTLLATKRLLGLRDAFFWIAIFLSGTPFSVWKTSWGNGWLIRDFPWFALTLATAAMVAWLLYFAMKRRLSSTGL